MSDTDVRLDPKKNWEEFKAWSRTIASFNRATPTEKGVRLIKGDCKCGHGWKHHKASGRCRPSCKCKAKRR